jgi:hypothetical protein
MQPDPEKVLKPTHLNLPGKNLPNENERPALMLNRYLKDMLLHLFRQKLRRAIVEKTQEIAGFYPD